MKLPVWQAGEADADSANIRYDRLAPSFAPVRETALFRRIT